MRILFAVWSLVFLGVAGLAKSEIRPYMPESELFAMVGKEASVAGVYFKDIFAAPAVLIKGHTFYLLQNPPSKRTYKFPPLSRPATVRGTLYFYDHAQLNNAEYGAIGQKYFFFNIDDSEIEYGTAEVSENLKRFIKTWKYNLDYTAERAVSNGMDQRSPQMMRNSRLLISEDMIHFMLFDVDSSPLPYTVLSEEEDVVKFKMEGAAGDTSRTCELEILEDGKLKVVTSLFGRSDRMTFYFDP